MKLKKVRVVLVPEARNFPDIETIEILKIFQDFQDDREFREEFANFKLPITLEA